MKIKTIALLAFLSGVLFSACSKYETQFEGPYKDTKPVGAGPIDNGPIIYEIVYVQDYTIHMASADLRRFKSLPTPYQAQKVAINYAHDRIAYKPKSGGNIIVIDTAGTEIEEVPNSYNVYEFDWHANNETLYMLESGFVWLHGPDVPLAYSSLYDAHSYPPNNDYYALTVLPDGSVAFGLNHNTGSSNYIGFWIGYSPTTGQNNHSLPVQGQYPETIHSSLDGNKLFALAGNTVGTFDSYSFNPFNTIATSVSSGAMSPDGQKFVYWSLDTRTLILHDTQFSVNVGYDEVTDMDW